jgi:D-amino-acid oxidase
MGSTEILVLGAGVMGLTTAIRLAESGLTVRVLTDRLPAETTSAVAGAIWGPYVISDSRVHQWSLRTLEALEAIATEPASGVRLALGIEASREMLDPPLSIIGLPEYARCGRSELPEGFLSGWRYRAPILDMPRHLKYLVRRAQACGVSIDLLSAPLSTISQASHLAKLVVNCTGLGSRSLVPDPELYPARGQLLIVANPGIEGFFSDHPESAEPTYFMAHGDHVVLGGTIVPRAHTLTPDLQVARRILDRCAAIEPRLATAAVREHRVGLRPVRPRIRLERTTHEGGSVIHNYGHGGSGVTLSWGCADEVRELIG